MKRLMSLVLVFALAVGVFNFTALADYENDYTEEKIIQPATTTPPAISFVPASASGQVAEFNVSVAPDNFSHTYIHPTTGGPEPINVQIGVTLHDSYVTGGRIELPLNFLSPATFDAAYQSQPFFIPRDNYTFPSEVTAWHIQPGASYDTLMLDLADGTGSSIVFNLTIPFDFNEDFSAKVPANTTMWNIQASVYIGSDLAQTSASTLVGGSSSAFSIHGELNIPRQGSAYTGGNIIINHTFSHTNIFMSTLDYTHQNRYFIDVPQGTVLLGALATWFTESEPITISGQPYTRHYRLVTDVPSDSWGNIGSLTHSTNLSNSTITPPETVPGDTFVVRRGFQIRFVNHPPQTFVQPISYTRIAPRFELGFNALHQNGGLTGILNNNTSLTQATVAQENFLIANATRNTGNIPIPNTSFVLYHHESNPASHRLNFNSITLRAGRVSDTTEWTSWQPEFEIVNASTGTTRTEIRPVWTPTATTNSASHGINFAALSSMLNPGEYISRVIVRAMGDGTQEGDFLPGNSLAIDYWARAWNNQVFPDGTPITQNPYSVAMAWQLHHDNATGVPQVRQGNTIHMRHGTIIGANAQLITDESSTIEAGSTLNYTLRGFNHRGYRNRDANAPWHNPRIIIQVPSILSVESIGDAVHFDGATHAATFARVGSDENWNFYEFTVPGYAAPDRTGSIAVGNPTFSIPIIFSVDEYAMAGTYDFGRVVMTQTDSENFIRPVGLTSVATNTAGADEALFGLALGERFFASARDSAPMLTILPRISLTADVSAKSDYTDGDFISAANLAVPADRGEEVVMRLTLRNGGNVVANSFRIYNILPYNGDLRGSTGDIEFVSVHLSGNGSTVRFADSSMSIPLYSGLNLQTYDFSGWPTTPGLGTGVRALFIDFNTLTLAPGESIDIDLTFRIPSDADQTVFNQFLFSFNDGSAFAPNLTSATAAFATEVITISYNTNLPAGVTETPGSWPTAATAIRGINGSGAEGTHFDILRVTNNTPTLANYTFVGWFANPAGTGTAYAANSQQSFATRQNLVLYARWQSVSITHTVTFTAGANGSITPTTTVSVENGEYLTAAQIPTPQPNTGYRFVGWFASGVSTNPTANPIIGDITFQARFERIPGDGNGDNPSYSLVISKTADTPHGGHVREGQTVTYTITVRNSGDAASGSIVITDNIPVGMTLVPDSATHTPSISGNTLTWNIPSIAAGQTIAVSFKVTVDALPANVYERIFRNTAVVNGHNTNTVNLTVRRLVKNPDRMTVNVGETINWTLSGFHNPLDSAAANFAIVDIPSLGLNFESGSIPAFTGGAGLTYDIRYRVAGSNTWHTHAANVANVDAGNPFTFSLPQPGNLHYTEIGLFFGTVPIGFGLGNEIVLTFIVSNDAPGNTLINSFLLLYDDTEREGSSPQQPTINIPGGESDTGDRRPTLVPTIPFSPMHHAYMIGDTNGMIRPNDSITRAEVATIFFRLITDDYRAQMWTQENPFPDVQIDHWFNNAVSTMTNAGVFSGMPDGTFQPGRPITRTEFAVAMTRFFTELPTEGGSMFSDINNHWAAAEINAAARMGWITGMPDGTFEPNRPITRAEAAALVNRILQRLPKTTADLLPGMIVWQDNANQTAWYYLYIQEASNSTEYEMQADGIHKTWTALIDPRAWELLERPTSRPEDIKE